MSMQRRPEAELMDDVAQAAAYAGADFSAANELFVDSLMARCQLASGAHVLDLGCGPADIPCRLAARIPGIHIDAIDGAAAMLALARRAVATASLDDRITLIQQHIYPGMPFARRYDAIISNSLLHHLDDPMTLWEVIRDNLPAGAAVVIMDLCRPVSEAEIRATSAGGPSATRSPPSGPPPGPRSITQSAARMTSRSCSTTITLDPASITSLRHSSSTEMSAGWSPVVGSSKT